MFCAYVDQSSGCLNYDTVSSWTAVRIVELLVSGEDTQINRPREAVTRWVEKSVN
jgi:hypothetical protein